MLKKGIIQRRIAEKFNVSYMNISNINLGKSYIGIGEDK